MLIGNIPVNGKDGCYSIREYQEAKTVAVQALEEIQQYRAIAINQQWIWKISANSCRKYRTD